MKLMILVVHLNLHETLKKFELLYLISLINLPANLIKNLLIVTVTR